MGWIFTLLVAFTLTPNPAVDFTSLDFPGGTTTAPEIALHLGTPLVSGNTVKIGYEIPYPGYIEFELFDEEKNKIWIDSKVKEKGQHYQAIRRDKLTGGATYTFLFYYKGKTYEGKFTG